MLPVNQFILSGDPLFNSGNLSEQIQYLEEQKRIIDARQKQLQQVANGNITISIPFINKGIMFNQSDLETFRQLLTK